VETLKLTQIPTLLKYFRKVLLKTISNLQNSLKTNPGKGFGKTELENSFFSSFLFWTKRQPTLFPLLYPVAQQRPSLQTASSSSSRRGSCSVSTPPPPDAVLLAEMNAAALAGL
jgi:hypothetical protein